MTTDKGIIDMNNHMRNIPRVLIVASLCFASGCITVGDKLINATNQEIHVNVYSKSGTCITRLIPPHETVGERREGPHGPSFMYARIEAFANSGREIGQFSLEDVSLKPAEYGRFPVFLITNDGVFPVPKKYLSDPEIHVNEIISFDRSTPAMHKAIQVKGPLEK